MKLFSRWIGPLAAALVLLVSALLISHARAETSPACFDELLLHWNELASDANRHIQTVEVDREKHRKLHEKIDHEFAAVKALACW